MLAWSGMLLAEQALHAQEGSIRRTTARLDTGLREEKVVGSIPTGGSRDTHFDLHLYRDRGRRSTQTRHPNVSIGVADARHFTWCQDDPG